MADPIGVCRVAPALVERVKPADVVEVVVGGDGHGRPTTLEQLELRAQIADPITGVHDEVPVAATHVPHVRLEERVEVILHEQHDVIGDPLCTEPSFGNGQILHSRSVKKTDDGSGRKQWSETIDALYEPTFGIATMSPSCTSGIGWSSAKRSLPSLM